MNYSIPYLTVFLVASFVCTFGGIILCRLNIKYLILSVLGLALVTVYLSESVLGTAILLVTFEQALPGFLLQYVLPLGFFIAATIMVTRWCLYVNYRGQRNANYVNEAPQCPPLILDKLRGKWPEFINWFTRKESITVCIIAAIVLAVHLIYIANPPSILGDERRYIIDANQFLQGRSMILPEHPPLGKWFIAAGVFIFGNNSVGWRVFSILFGIADIFIFYFICLRLVEQTLMAEGQKEILPIHVIGTRVQPTNFIPVMATFLFATENLSFVLAHLAMLDIFSFSLMLLGFLFYLRGNHLSCGIAMGLSIMCKETAVVGVLIVLVHWVVTRRDLLTAEMKYMYNALKGRNVLADANSEIMNMSKLVIPLPVVCSLLFPLLEYGKTPQWTDPIARALYMVWYNLIWLNSPDFVPGFGAVTKPWAWLAWPSMENWNVVALVPHYLGSIGWTVWALVIPAMIYMLYETVRVRARGQNLSIFALFWFMGTYGLFFIWALFGSRSMYLFYFYPTIPAVCLAIAWSTSKIWRVVRKRPQTEFAFMAALVIYLVGTVVTFIIMSPMTAWIN